MYDKLEIKKTPVKHQPYPLKKFKFQQNESAFSARDQSYKTHRNTIAIGTIAVLSKLLNVPRSQRHRLQNVPTGRLNM